MYFPYVRGRQYELLALRELVFNNLLGSYLIPIIEPVKLSSTLTKTMSEYIKANHPISIIRNPLVGSFLKDLKDVKDGSKEASYKEEFLTQYENASIIRSVIIQRNAQSLLEYWAKMGIHKNELLVISIDRDYLDLYEREFDGVNPKYALIPDESTFRRRVRRNRVLLDDKFEKQSRNADYLDETDEFFSDDHLYFKDDGNLGFSDYSVIGNKFLEAGFAPYAVAIHIVYFAADKSLRVKHFVSDSNEDISNPAKKFYEAVSKLAAWYETEPKPVELTLGLKTLLEHYANQTYPGLGIVKKLSLMHHLELMGKYLSEVG
ncbi:MAG: sce7725 family protein [Desulfitobacterium hafniense]|nr:sce7725 family protein [Desulfitobacterium hafniense]